MKEGKEKAEEEVQYVALVLVDDSTGVVLWYYLGKKYIYSHSII